MDERDPSRIEAAVITLENVDTSIAESLAYDNKIGRLTGDHTILPRVTIDIQALVRGSKNADDFFRKFEVYKSSLILPGVRGGLVDQVRTAMENAIRVSKTSLLIRKYFNSQKPKNEKPKTNPPGSSSKK